MEHNAQVKPYSIICDTALVVVLNCCPNRCVPRVHDSNVFLVR